MCLKRILPLILLCRQPWTVTNSLHIWFFSVFSHQYVDEIQPVISKVTWKRPHFCYKGCSSGLVGRCLMFTRGGKEFFPKILSHFPLFLLIFFPFFVFLFIFGGWICYFPPSFFSFFVFTFLKTFLFILLDFDIFIKHNLIMFTHHSVPSTTSSDPHGVFFLILWPFKNYC